MKIKLLLKCTILFIFTLVFMTTSITAQWISDPNTNLLICDETRDQMSPHMDTDGSGGVIIAWWDNRNITTSSDIYIQRVNSTGSTQWTEDGILICNADGQQTHPRVISDGSNGAIIVWRDYRDGSNSATMYAQKVNSSGEAQWTTNGISLTTTTNHKRQPYACSDGSGGAIVTWDEQATSGARYDIRAQRINSSGIVQWGTNGVLVYDDQSEQYDQENPHITFDGSGGCIIAFQDEREGSAIPLIYAQRLNSSGTRQWGSEAGIKVCSDASLGQYNPFIISDASANSIIGWYDYRSGGDYDIYSQKLNSSGSRLWTTSGTLVCSATGHQGHPQLVTDGSGGAIITWYDDIYGSNSNIYAQRVNNSGSNVWTSNGEIICNATSDQETNDYKYETIVSDGSGGAIISWWDKRGGSTPDIYAQRINSSGVVHWTTNGMAVCTASYGQWNPTLYPDGNSGAFIIWMDYRNDSSVYDIYMQRLYSEGALPVVLTSFTATQNENSITLNWETATEVNNYCFEVERKKYKGESDVEDEEWNTIGFVQGHGNSNSPKEYEFIDDNLDFDRNHTLKYRLKQIDTDGTFEYYGQMVEIELNNSITTIDEKTIPLQFHLSQNFPNPFNPSTQIEYSLASDQYVSLKIYNNLGQLVATVVNEFKVSGQHIADFNSGNLTSGVYLYELKAGEKTLVKKMILAK